MLPCVHGALSLSVSFTIGLACDAWNFQVDPVYLYWHNMTRCGFLFQLSYLRI